MKFSKRNLSTLVILVILGIFIGSFAWEILERIVILVTRNPAFSISLTQPVQLFDLYVLAVSFRANPGTLLGFVGSLLIFGRL